MSVKVIELPYNAVLRGPNGEVLFEIPCHIEIEEADGVLTLVTVFFRDVDGNRTLEFTKALRPACMKGTSIYVMIDYTPPVFDLVNQSLFNDLDWLLAKIKTLRGEDDDTAN